MNATNRPTAADRIARRAEQRAGIRAALAAQGVHLVPAHNGWRVEDCSGSTLRVVGPAAGQPMERALITAQVYVDGGECS